MIHIGFAYAFPRIRICVGVKFYADSEFEVKILFLRTHFRENHFLKNFRGRIQKNFIALNSK